jgi:hypothetical protein
VRAITEAAYLEDWSSPHFDRTVLS